MIRIFQTGDNHIGMKYASHEKREVLAGARLSAFENMVKAANENECGLFVITGDLFDNTYAIAKKSITALVDLLSGFRGTVAVLPGNHDYYDPDAKLWQDFTAAVQRCDNIMILNQYRPYRLTVGEEEVVLYPAFCKSHHSGAGENNLGWIKETPFADDGAYRIGIAHGAVEGKTIDSEGRYFLMSEQELEEIEVDVWLLGHTHVPFPQGLDDSSFTPGGKIFNSGTHVQTDVACNTRGLCFLLELDKKDGQREVRAKAFRSGNVTFCRRNLSLTADNMRGQLADGLSDLPDNCVVDLIVDGAVTAEEYENRTQILEQTLSRFLESTFHDGGLSRLITGELIAAEFPETSFSAGLLTQLLDEPKQAQLAFELLQTLQNRYQ